jgi:hypothetical protein
MISAILLAIALAVGAVAPATTGTAPATSAADTSGGGLSTGSVLGGDPA